MTVKKDQKKPVTVEDLLKIKRHEKPSEAFWARFDRELQEKTWMALAKKPSFLERLSSILRPVVLPIGAAAAFLFVFFVYNETGVTQPMGNDSGILMVSHKALEDATPEEVSAINEVFSNYSAKNYVKEVISVRAAENDGFKRVLTHNSLASGAQKGVQYLASAFTQSSVSELNVNQLSF